MASLGESDYREGEIKKANRAKARFNSGSCKAAQLADDFLFAILYLRFAIFILP